MSQSVSRSCKRPSSLPTTSGVHKYIVMPGHNQVGDFIHLGKRILGELDVVGVGKHLAGLEMVLGGHRVTGDERGAGRLGDEEPACPGGVAREGKKVEPGDQLIGRGKECIKKPKLDFQERTLGIIGQGLRECLLQKLVDCLLFRFIDKRPGFGEEGQAGTVRRAKVGEEDGVDLFRQQASAFEQASLQCKGRQAGVDQYVTFTGTDERSGGMGGAHRLRFFPKSIATECTDADDVISYGGHHQTVTVHRVTMQDAWRCVAGDF